MAIYRAPAPVTPPPGIWTTNNSTASGPSMSFEDALKKYQSLFPTASKQTYEGIFDWLKQQGFKVERPTHAGGTLPSEDKVVDQTTGKVWDIIFAVDDPTQAKWVTNDTGEYWYNGAPQGTTPPTGGTNTTLGGTNSNNRRTESADRPRPGRGDIEGGTVPGTGGSLPSATTPQPGTGKSGSSTNGKTDYAAAYAAARRQRQKAAAGGRRSTILGGFRSLLPATRGATLLGR